MTRRVRVLRRAQVAPVLAHGYSHAHLVEKTHEFTYLAASDMTVRLNFEGSEKRDEMHTGAGGAMLVSREVLDGVGGFPCVPRSVDLRLFEKIRGHGSRVYRTHGAGFVRVWHGENHTWDAVGDEWFLDRADSVSRGWDPDQACIADMDASYIPWSFALVICAVPLMMVRVQHDTPPPQLVRYNDWMRVEMPAPGRSRWSGR